MSQAPNPFLGPQPYRAEDRARFFGREAVTRKVARQILAWPCLTLFGPSGAGKSSLMQAGVVPLLEEKHGFRTVRVDGWLASEHPLQWMIRALFTELELGAVPEGMAEHEALDEAIRLAERRSERPVLLYLDQLEQLFLPGWEPGEVGDLLEGLARLTRMPFRGLQLVLMLREDYLGRFRDRARGWRELLEQGYRLGPLSVREMVEVACRLAAWGSPAQQWPEQEVRGLMLQVRMAGQEALDEAEVQAAFGQIVCRALWEERAEGRHVAGPVEAEPILHRYLEATLEALGPLRADALRLLEERLVASDGSRALLTEQQARAELPPEDAEKVLNTLERTAVLRAEEHGGSRYFELGHDWLARKVFELREERVRQEEAERRLEQERARRRKLLIGGALALVLVLVLGGLLLWALSQKATAVEQAERARDQALMAGARKLLERGQPAMAIHLLLEIHQPERVRGWGTLAHDVLTQSFPEVTFRVPYGVNAASISPDGQHVLMKSGYQALVWRVDGRGKPVVLWHEKIHSAAFSPDGQYVVTAGEDGMARVHRVDGKGEPVVLKGHAGPVVSAAFSPDGQRVVTASKDGTARVWRADGTGEPGELKGHTGPVVSATFGPDSPDGQRVVTAGEDGTARVWRADGTGEPVVLRHEGRVDSATFSPDGQHVVTLNSGAARVWRADGRGTPVVLKGQRGAVVSAAFSPDGQLVVTAGEDRTARVWRADGKDKPAELKGHAQQLTSAAFSPDGQSVVTASLDGTVRVWRTGMGEAVVLKHKEQVYSAVFTPDGQRVVTASDDKAARVWWVEGTGEPVVLSGVGQVDSAAFSPDGQRVFTRGHQVWTWRADGKGPLVELKQRAGSLLVFAAFSPDGQHVAMVYLDGVVQVWRTDGTGEPVELKHEGRVGSAAFSPDGQRVVTVGEDRTARVWRVDGTGEPVVLRGHATKVTSAAFSPDGQRVVTTSGDETARVWQADGKGEPVVLKQEERVDSAAFSPDGQHVLTRSFFMVRVWRADGKGKPVELKEGFGWEYSDKMVVSAAFSPDGQHVVTAYDNGTARVWRADGRGHSVVLEGHAETLTSVAFSPDSQSVVTASWDGTARVRRADGSGEPVELQGHNGWVVSAAFSPDGRRVVTAGADETVRIWSVSIPDLQQHLRAASKDCLPPELRQIHLDENERQALKGYAKCERSYDRPPPPPPPLP
ncbi:WD40 repeat protein [Archangium gephyra]|uniref:High-affnity carbon uptake protein Hat/HatR n=1 Tax=Archangium gephyra TaxID=48 RepID=A0AAC8TDT5_9BACT|nr:hypothetical protein [Archangium gephyra]AKJ02098.1 High-affnity carbon uptake protein Hat/HatR [Archangium gephyra]REG28970.1 WD40 repeat protein [Archangium gephyra]